ncbi:DNA mismatch repair protein MutS [Marinilabiliaceae bacterium JC040]|nr:DNA mismatch repair protein MutS [Marinilabiliaceae bacterium JC040]
MDDYSLGYIKEYYEGIDKSIFTHFLSDETCNDLDFDDLFTVCDNTSSKIGQQYLYAKLRTADCNNSNFEYQEKLIDLIKSKNIHSNIKKNLSKLKSHEAYYICRLFKSIDIPYIRFEKYLKIFPLINILLISSVFFIPHFFLVLLPIFMFNMWLHYKNKSNILMYSEIFTQLIFLENVARNLSKKGLNINNENIEEALSSINNINKRSFLIRIQSKFQADLQIIIWFIFEFVKIILAIEPLIFNRILKDIEKNIENIKLVFDFVGRVDSTSSVLTLREQLSSCCIPNIVDDSLSLKAVEMVHPLVENCIPNNINIFNKSVLITGSNMAGKTTFIRAIGINAITAFSINTCFAKSFSIGRFNLYSTIRVSDSVLSEKSYYLEEVLRIKNIINNSQKDTHSLILLDELYKGTNTVERIACAKAVLSYLTNNNIVVATTHDLELCEFLVKDYDIYNFGEKVVDNLLSFDYLIKKGPPQSRNAIKILKQYGYPSEIIDDSYDIVSCISSR